MTEPTHLSTNQSQESAPVSAQTASNDAMAMMRYDANKKSTGLAYVLWFFLGGFGVHRFYLGSNGVGILVLACTLLGIFTLVPLIVTFIVLIYDLFTLPGQVRRHNMGVAAHAGSNQPI